MKIAIVNFSTGKYVNIRKKHQEPFIKKYCPNVEYFPLESYQLIGSPSHNDSPYAFKPYCISYLKNKGYDIVIWMDSPFAPIKPIDDWILDIQEKGVWVAQDGWYIGQWANDNCLKYFNETRDDMMKINNQYGSICFNFSNPIAHEYLSKWIQAEQAGVFKGQHTNKNNTESNDSRCLGHRHDQSCSEIISHQLKIKRSTLEISKQYYKAWQNL